MRRAPCFSEKHHAALSPPTLSRPASADAGQVPMKRPAQPAELATAYVMLADPLSS